MTKPLHNIVDSVGSAYLSLNSRPLLLFTLFSSILIFFKFFDSFGIEEAADRSVASAATTILGPSYGGDKRVGQKYISLATQDDRTLEYLGIDGFPIPYDKQLEILQKIAAAKPRAILVDSYYTKSRIAFRERDEAALALGLADETPPDPAVKRLADGILEINKTIPVFIGSVSQFPALAPLKRVPNITSLNLPPGFKNEYFGLVPVESLYDINGSRQISDSPLNEQGLAPLDRRSAALKVYLTLCELGTLPDLKTNQEDCSKTLNYFAKGNRFMVQWGFGASENQLRQLPKNQRELCDTRKQWLGGMFGIISRGLLRSYYDKNGDNSDIRCSYHDRVPLHKYLAAYDAVNSGTAGEGEAEDLKFYKQIFAGDIIFVGIDSTANGDRWAAPIYKEVPGVAIHAMAFDNLLEYKGDVPLLPGGFYNFDYPDLLQIGFSLITILVIFGLRKTTQKRFMPNHAQLTPTMAGIVLVVAMAGCIVMAFVTYYLNWSIPMMLTTIVAPAALTAICIVILSRPPRQVSGDIP